MPWLFIDVAKALILMAPFGLESVGPDPPLDHPLSVVDHPGLRGAPAVLRVAPETLCKSCASRPQLEETQG